MQACYKTSYEIWQFDIMPNICIWLFCDFSMIQVRGFFNVQ